MTLLIALMLVHIGGLPLWMYWVVISAWVGSVLLRRKKED